jgi:hypothetical protein
MAFVTAIVQMSRGSCRQQTACGINDESME